MTGHSPTPIAFQPVSGSQGDHWKVKARTGTQSLL